MALSLASRHSKNKAHELNPASLFVLTRPLSSITSRLCADANLITAASSCELNASQSLDQSFRSMTMSGKLLKRNMNETLKVQVCTKTFHPETTIGGSEAAA